MLYLLLAAGCFLMLMSGSLWLILTAITLLVIVIYPSVLFFLGLLALLYVILHFWNT